MHRIHRNAHNGIVLVSELEEPTEERVQEMMGKGFHLKRIGDRYFWMPDFKRMGDGL